MTDVEWGDPPPTNARSGGYSVLGPILKALREKPGQWAKVASSTTSDMAGGIKTGRYVDARPAGAFEATSRLAGRTDRGTAMYDVYARYVGEPS
jgi:hypothetical protein